MSAQHRMVAAEAELHIADLVLGEPIWGAFVMSSAFSQGPEDIPAATKKHPGFLPGDEAHHPLSPGCDLETNL